MLNALQFFDRLRNSRLFAAEEVDALADRLARERPGQDGESLARALVEEETLTAYQATTLLAGRGKSLVLGDYVLLRELGEGGMGQVFQARHRRLKRVVALKLLPTAMTQQPAAIKRFQREMEAAAMLTHPNIVATHDAREQAGVHYLVMEYVAGDDLANLVKKQGPLAVEAALDYLRQTATGLAYAHKQGVIHRDVKPANLLLDPHGVVKILDMGLARFDGQQLGEPGDGLTKTGSMMGSVDFMAPEQALDSKHADTRADIYSLGCTLFFLLTGRSMYDGDTFLKRVLAHREQPLPSTAAVGDHVPASVYDLFRRMAAKRPEERFQSMEEVLAAIAECRHRPLPPAAKSEPPVAAPPPAPLRTAPPTVPPPAAPETPAVVPPSAAVALAERMPEVVSESISDTRVDPTTNPESPSIRVEGPSAEEPSVEPSPVEPSPVEPSPVEPSPVEPSPAEPQTVSLAGSATLPAPSSGASEPGSVSWRPQPAPREFSPWWLWGGGVLAVALAGLSIFLSGFWSKPQEKPSETAGLQPQEKAPSEIVNVPSPMPEKPLEKPAVPMEPPQPPPPKVPDDPAPVEPPPPPMPFVPVGERPPLLVVPFDAAAAKASQEAWAKHLGKPSFVEENSIGMKMVLIPAGDYVMGSPLDEAGRLVDETQYEVRVAAPFYCGAHEATVGQFRQFVNATQYKTVPLHEGEEIRGWNEAKGEYDSGKQYSWDNPGWKQTDDHPVVNVSWNDAMAFCKWLSEKEKQEYHLPTEVEWEYACRAGTITPWPTGADPGDALGSGRFPEPTVANALFRPNSFGLCAMHQNVSEWCLDLYRSSYFDGIPREPTATGEDDRRVQRGGNCVFPLRSARRQDRYIWTRDHLVGFRVVRTAAVPFSYPARAPKLAGPSAEELDAARPAGTERQITNTRFVWCPPGKFMMGSPDEEADREDDEKQVNVTLTKGFWLTKTEVTQAQWKQVMGTTPWSEKEDVEQAAVNAATYVSWDDAQEFCRKFTEAERAAKRLTATQAYDLPTEAQWEYACRAGTTTAFGFGDDATELDHYGWFESNAFKKEEEYAHGVGLKKQNPWGLHDLHGNVREWCRDAYLDRLPGGIDPLAAVEKKDAPRVLRGGSWFDPPSYLRSACRDVGPPHTRSGQIGFRIVLTP